MIRYFKKIWADLGRSIFTGDRYEKNMRGLAVGALLIVVMNLITGSLNLAKGMVSGAVSSLILILVFLLVFFFIVVMKNRKVALFLTVFAVIGIYSYDVITVTSPIMPIWTLLFPCAFCYLVNVKAGIGLSAYFSVLYLVLFYSPLKQVVAGKYPDFIM
ncbi:MAG: hypothetical protein IKS88_03125, partial [Clostridia bacterium]|nr:hypothetical protein [Clostridia bacterium]